MTMGLLVLIPDRRTELKRTWARMEGKDLLEELSVQVTQFFNGKRLEPM